MAALSRPIALLLTCKNNFTNSYIQPPAPLLTFSSRLVCPSCVMFGKAKQQPVIDPHEAVKLLRESFDRSIKTGRHHFPITV